MKQLCYLLIIIFFVSSCEKDGKVAVTGYIFGKSNEYGGAFVVLIDNPDPKVHDFICTGPFVNGLSHSCLNSIVFTNINRSVLDAGMHIRFSRWSDKGPNPLTSFSGTAHNVEIYDAKQY